MPVNGVKGAWGGFVQGRKGAQTFKSNEVIIEGNEISNKKSQAEFLYYLDTRKQAKNILKGQSSAAQVLQETERSTIRSSNLKNESDALSHQRNIDNNDLLSRNDKQNLETAYDVSRAQEGTAERAIQLEDETLVAERNSLSRQAQVDFLGMERDQVNYLAEVLSPLGEAGTPGYGQVDDQSYDAMINQLTEVFGKNSEQIFKKYGITQRMTPQGVNAMKAIRTSAVHSVGTQQAEHLAMIKGQIDTTIAAAKATGSYDAKSILGKLMQDQGQWQQKAMDAPAGSVQQKQAFDAYSLFQENINALIKEENAKSDQKQTEARDLTLKSNFPMMASALENGEGGSQEAWAKLTSMQDFLNQTLTQEQTMQMLTRWYGYEYNTIFDDELILREPNDVLRSTARVHRIMQEMISTTESGAGFNSMSDEELGAVLLDLDRQSKIEADAKYQAAHVTTTLRN